MAEYLISEAALLRNARELQRLGSESGARMLIALKAFCNPTCISLLRPYARGCCASGLYEAKLGSVCHGGHIAVFSPAYRDDELRELLNIAHHIDFNSLSQWARYRSECLAHPRVQSGELQLGLRINPCHSTGHTPLYDPCIPGSRLGIPPQNLSGADLSGLSGLHIHTLCEQGAAELIETFRALENSLGDLLASPQMRYLNLGGGHWITKPDYDRAALVDLLRDIRRRYRLDVYLEPGEAWFIHTGVLRAQVLDTFESLGYRHAILDVSASAHMPDVLEMPYRPDVYLAEPSPGTPAGDPSREPLYPAVQRSGTRYIAASESGQKAYDYRLGAPTCLAGDVIGDYSFDRELRVGDQLVFDDMTHYTMVKTTHFNGVPHPSIALERADGSVETLYRPSYQDFAAQLG